MSESYAQQLASVRAAIAEVEAGGQEVQFEGRRVKFADLSLLYKREERLMALAAREARGGGFAISRGAGA